MAFVERHYGAGSGRTPPPHIPGSAWGRVSNRRSDMENADMTSHFAAMIVAPAGREPRIGALGVEPGAERDGPVGN